MAKKAADTTSDNTDAKKNGEAVLFWINELAAARKREKDWRKQGQKILDIYDGTESVTTPYNVLFSNTETMLPALYSAIPRPVVTRRYKDDDPLGRLSAMAAQRGLEFMLDTNIDGYETFNEAMKSAGLDGCLPGRGVTTVKYDYEEGKEKSDSGEETPYKKSELVCADSKIWNRVLFGYAKKWSKVPWVAYEEHLDQEEAKRLFGDNASKLTFTKGEQEDEEGGEKESSTEDERNTGERKTALCYQIWDKSGGRKVRYVAEQYKDDFLLVQDDPLELTGFFNCPRPLQFIEKNDREPVALYTLYENQARELNRLTIRINKCIEAIKARGAYDSALGGTLEKIFNSDETENALVPTDTSSAIGAEKGFDKAIWMIPIDTLVNVLDKLYLAREQCKQVIYEIIGIADIMRGSSKASETLGAQEIKNQWGTLRIKPKQAEVQRYARDLLRMMLEIASTKFSEQTWAAMTGMPFVTSEKKAQMQAMAQAAQQMGQQLQPQDQAELAKPSWGDILGLLRDDTQRAYRIDIETNSTIEPEAAEDQKNISEMLGAFAQVIAGAGPLVEKGVMPFEVLKNILLAISRRYRFGTEIEDDIKAMKPPPPPPDDGKAQAEQAKLQLDGQRLQMETAAKQAEQQAAAASEAAKHQREVAAEANRVQLERERAAQEHEREMARIAAERSNKLAELQAERETAKIKAAIEQDTELRKAQIQADTAVAVARIQGQAKVMVEREKPEPKAAGSE